MEANLICIASEKLLRGGSLGIYTLGSLGNPYEGHLSILIGLNLWQYNHFPSEESFLA
jgi:hypothetical protein